MEVKSILKEQSSVKVVLNGGKYQLEQATIPFQIGFDKAIADKKPTHILVIDVTNDPFYKENGERKEYDSYSERTFFEIEPVQHLQLHKDGVHRLIFVLFGFGNSRYTEKQAMGYFLDKKFSGYDNDLSYRVLENLKEDYQLGYAEVVVDVPKELFASEPETKFQKAIHRWVNSWYKQKPMDECDYRKRAIWAFTAKPILWLLGLVPRIICSILLAVIIPVIRLLFFFAGLQPVYFFPNYKKLFTDFLFLYPCEGYERVFGLENWTGYLGGKCDEDIYDYKTLAIGKKRIHIPITFFGLVYYSFMFLLYGWAVYGFGVKFYPHIVLSFFATVGLFFLSLVIAHSIIITISTSKKGEEWEKKWRVRYNYDHKKETEKGKEVAVWITSILTSIAILSFLVTQVPWKSVGKATAHVTISVLPVIIGLLAGCLSVLILFYIYKWLSPKLGKIMANSRHKTNVAKFQTPITVREKREQKQIEWLEKSFDINKLPVKVDIKKIPEPSSFVHKFEIAFWQLKAKVCKPYARK